ncbi:6-phosphogluconolactonase [Pontibacter chitinilyticus]|uniref:6-phosphogluconolactonase n=1 Tax=Pontibacter chitinilyticus TaxID=2674989 RepID=UPI00321A26DB
MKHIFEDTDSLLSAMATFFVSTCRDAITARGRFIVALSGGSSPKRLFDKLASPAYNQQVDWSKVYFFFGDERYVPADDPENNALMARKALFDPLNIPDSQVFAINTALSPSLSAEAYAQTIQAHFQQEQARFDLILLGLGNDAHTASLFPKTTVLREQKATVKAVFLPDQQVFRITLTAPLINQAREVAFLVYGAAKADAVHRVLEGKQDTSLHPAQLIQPDKGHLHWFLDKTAASLLNQK